MLQVKVGELTNQNQQLKRKLDQHSSRTASGIKKPTDIVTPKATTASPVTPEGSVASIIWDSLLQTSKQKSSRKIALSSKASTAKHKLRKHLGTRLDKVVVRVRKTITLEDQIETFMLSDENSFKCPDKKKGHLRYRLTYLHVLHETFCTEYKVYCSYSNFCKLVPSNIVKPKPQDWGTCLCMSCLNPQLKMEALCNLDSSLYVDTEEVIKYTKTELHEWGEKIRHKMANLLPVLRQGKERL